jgi:hypothetical protein
MPRPTPDLFFIVCYQNQRGFRAEMFLQVCGEFINAAWIKKLKGFIQKE